MAHSLLVEESLDVGQEVVGVLAVAAEPNDVTILVQKVLEEVPLDVVVGALRLQVLVKVASVVTLDVDLT